MASKKRSTPLEWHLQTACYLELWTIPLYLTAAYSIKTDDKASAGIATAVQRELLSVVVQEMYHLQLACNLAAAFGLKPTLKNPSYDKLPCLKGNKAIPVELGNAYDVIDLLIEVETPDAKNDPPTTPPKRKKDGSYEYNSIGDLYNVMRNLALKHWDDAKYKKIRADKKNSTGREKVGPNFKSRYKFDRIETVWDLQNAIAAIVDQGEGMQHESPQPNSVDPRVPKKYQPKQGSRFYDYDELSHYDRFKHAKIRMYSDETYDPTNEDSKLIEVYPLIKKPTAAQRTKQVEAQKNLSIFYSQFLQSMRAAWATSAVPKEDAGWSKDGELNGNFFQSMYFLKPLIIEVWKAGAVPKFKEVKVTHKQYMDLFDKLDPNYSYHQSDLDANLKAYIESQPNKDMAKYAYHSCQGLNMCKSMGHNHSGTKPGDGACATNVPHTCSQGNDCKYQGGCAYSPYSTITNSCKATGGCETPISPQQIMAGGKNKDKPVWDVARAALAKRLGKKVSSLPKIKTANARRNAVKPTNTK